MHDSVRIIWSDDRSNFRLDDPSKRSKSARAAARKLSRRPMIYIVIWPQRSGLFRVRVCPRGLTNRPSLDAKLASTGAVFFDSASAGGGGPAAAGGARKPHTTVSGGAGGSGAGGGASAGGVGAGGAGGAAASVVDDSKLRSTASALPSSSRNGNPRLTRNGLSQYWVRSVSSQAAQAVFDEWRESVTNEKHVLGPILTDMLVNAASLCSYVREACINATRLLTQLENGVANPFQPRLTTIKRVAKQYTNSVPPAQFYHSLFMQPTAW